MNAEDVKEKEQDEEGNFLALSMLSKFNISNFIDGCSRILLLYLFVSLFLSLTHLLRVPRQDLNSLPKIPRAVKETLHHHNA